MSSCYFILPYDPKAWEDPDDNGEKPTSDLKIYSVDFQTALSEHWGPDRINKENNTIFLQNAWILTNANDAEGGRLRVNLHDDYQVIAFYPGPKHILIEFVLWYRKFIPARYPLYLTHSSSFNRLHLTADTTAQDIIEFAGVVS